MKCSVTTVSSIATGVLAQHSATLLDGEAEHQTCKEGYVQVLCVQAYVYVHICTGACMCVCICMEAYHILGVAHHILERIPWLRACWLGLGYTGWLISSRDPLVSTSRPGMANIYYHTWLHDNNCKWCWLCGSVAAWPCCWWTYQSAALLNPWTSGYSLAVDSHLYFSVHGFKLPMVTCGPKIEISICIQEGGIDGEEIEYSCNILEGCCNCSGSLLALSVPNFVSWLLSLETYV